MDKKMTAQASDEALIHNFDQSGTPFFFTTKMIIVLLIVAFLGVGTGYFLASNGGKLGVPVVGKDAGSLSAGSGTVIGSDDLETFKDTTEGVLQVGGIEGEGQYHLVRPGGESQNVYLTSSIVDLSEFIEKKIKVWGQTQQAQRAGWLMDVGRVEVLE